MKILIGPDSLKGSVTAHEFCQIAKEVILKHWPEDQVITLPLADGGEGTVQALVEGQKGRYIDLQVKGPLFEEIKARYGLIENGRVAIIEMAAASGLPLVPTQTRNPMLTTTYGTGQMILDAIRRGVKEIIIGIGGSATNDGGLGMLQAMGYQCLDKNGQDVLGTGQGLLKLHTIIPTDLDLSNVKIKVACDVNNPLYGEDGAAYVYGPQKGADPQMIKTLDQGLKNFARIAQETFHMDLNQVPGSGAAGGLGAGLMILGGHLEAGFEIIRQVLCLDDILSTGIDWVITGEGQMNQQSLNGKLPVELAKLAKSYDIKTIALVGARDLSSEDLKETGILAVFPILNKPMSLEESMQEGKDLMKETILQIMNLIHSQ